MFEMAELTAEICRLANIDCLKVITQLVHKISGSFSPNVNHHQVVKTIVPSLQLLYSLVKNYPELDRDDFQQKLCDIVWRVCMPLLQQLHPTKGIKDIHQQVLFSVCDLQVECLMKMPTLESQKVLEILAAALDKFSEMREQSLCDSEREQDLDDVIDLSCVIEFLQTFLRRDMNSAELLDLAKVFDELFSSLVCMFPLISEKMFADVISRGLLHILRMEKHKTDSRLNMLWNQVQCLCERNSKFEDQTLLLFCGLADFFFPVSENIPSDDIQKSGRFWGIVQRGIYSENPLSRKRSLYLLKRVVDTCEKRDVDVNVRTTDIPYPVFQWQTTTAKEQAKLWENYILLVETLEEKQVHVIKPLLERMQLLIKAASTEGCEYFFHTSWLVTLFCRCFQHESHYVVRRAVDAVLGMDLTLVSFFEQGQLQFLAGDFIYVLQDLRLYQRPAGVDLGTCPPVGVELINFFTNCIEALKTTEKQNGFLTVLCKTLLSHKWGSIPIFYICQALAAIPSLPIVNTNILLNIKDIVVTLMTTLEQQPKGAVQCFLVQTVLHLTDRSQVSVEDMATILAVFDRKESLQRGTLLWEEVANWLKESVKQSFVHWTVTDVQKVIKKMVQAFLADQSESGVYNLMLKTKIGRLLILALDADIFEGDQDVVRILALLIDVINSANTHAYLDKVKADRAVALLTVIAVEHISGTVAGSVQGGKVIHHALAGCWNELVSYIGRRVTQDITQVEDLVLVDVYCKSLETCLYFLHPSVCVESLYRLTALCVKTLQANISPKYLDEQLLLVSSFSVVAAITTIIKSIADTSSMTVITKTIVDYAAGMTLNCTFSKQPARDSKGNIISQKNWGRVVSRYISDQWQCIHFLMERSPDLIPTSRLLDACCEALDVGTRDSDVHVLGCIQFLLPQLVTEAEECVCDMVHVGWVKANEELHTATYWRKLKCFVKLICQTDLLIADPGTSIHHCLREHMSLLFQLGQDKMGVVNLLMEHLYPVLTSQEHGICVANNFCSILADACVFGGIRKRTDRLALELSAYIECQGRKWSVNDVLTRLSKSDGIVRAFIVKFISHLDPSREAHVEFTLALSRELYSRYNTLVEAAEYRQYNNSLCHRQKNRIFQVLTVLEPFIATEESQEELWVFVWRCLMYEAHPSVRHMQEWLVMRQVYRFPQLVNKLWEFFNQFNDKRNLSLCSLMHVISQLGPHQPSHKQGEFFNRALTSLLPWCLAHHFNTRVHAQASLCKIWQQCQQLGHYDLINKHSILQTILIFQSDNNNSTKNLQKLTTNYFYHTFDFLRDYSLETIFHTLPRLAMLTDEEWLQPEVFIYWGGSVSQIVSQHLPLYNQSSHLKECFPGAWKMKPPVDQACEEQENTGGDVQKKIMPWRLMSAEEDLECQADNKKIHKPGGMVLVTSLIDKIPNLGGLCRTSEIFGVSEFIIGSLCFIEDKAFQCLSVTAHNWIPITEVPPHRLQQFLDIKRREGYTLVGAEQTANSVSLPQYKFSPKTLLLLGNEKEGIPVNLIQLLDVCVEIPQQGIIRSLNVHVSGALMVWEYARQQMEAVGITA